MKTASLIILFEKRFTPLPETVSVREFGSETIVDPNTGRPKATGVSQYITGPIHTIREWITKNGGAIWTSNNPMVGDWEKKTL